jgi:cell division protein ZapA
MALVNVLVNGRAYTVACDDGEEEHLRDLAEYLDKRVRQLVETVGQVGDARLLLMAGLVVVDELAEALGRVAELESEQDKDAKAGDEETAAEAEGSSSEDIAAEALEFAAARLEDIAAKIART